jgi:hypothetical protein
MLTSLPGGRFGCGNITHFWKFQLPVRISNLRVGGTILDFSFYFCLRSSFALAAVLGILTHFLDLLDPDPFVRGMDPDLDPALNPAFFSLRC